MLGFECSCSNFLSFSSVSELKVHLHFVFFYTICCPLCLCLSDVFSDDFRYSGFSRKVGGGRKLSQLGPAPLPQSLSPHLPLSSLSLEATQAPSNSLSVLDFSQITKQPPGARTGLQKRRKKTIAIPKGLTKEEYFSKLENF